MILAIRNLRQRRDPGPCLIFLFRNVGAFIFRCIRCERTKRDVAHDLAVPFEHHVACVGNLADNREVQLPLLENRGGHFLFAGLQNHEHTLLALAQHHLVRGHALFAARHLVHVEPDAGLAIGCHFDAGASQARRAHILYRDDRIGRHQLKTGFDQQFFGEWVANLYRRPFGIGILFKIGAGHRGTVDPVTPCL